MTRRNDIDEIRRRVRRTGRFTEAKDGSNHWCIMNKTTGEWTTIPATPSGEVMALVRGKLKRIGFDDHHRPSKKLQRSKRNRSKRQRPTHESRPTLTPTASGSVPMPAFSDLEAQPAQRYADAPTLGADKNECARYAWRVLCAKGEPMTRQGVEGFRWEGRFWELIQEIWPAFGEFPVELRDNSVARLRDYLKRIKMIDTITHGNRNVPSVWFIRGHWQGESPQPIGQAHETIGQAHEPIGQAHETIGQAVNGHAAGPVEVPTTQSQTAGESVSSPLDMSFRDAVIFLEDYNRLSGLAGKVKKLTNRLAELDSARKELDDERAVIMDELRVIT